jgi:hypothetical protein
VFPLSGAATVKPGQKQLSTFSGGSMATELFRERVNDQIDVVTDANGTVSLDLHFTDFTDTVKQIMLSDFNISSVILPVNDVHAFVDALIHAKKAADHHEDEGNHFGYPDDSLEAKVIDILQGKTIGE